MKVNQNLELDFVTETLGKKMGEQYSVVVAPSELTFNNLDSLGVSGKNLKLTKESIDQIYSYSGVGSRFSKSFFTLSHEKNKENVWRETLDLFKSKMEGMIHFRVDPNTSEILGVGSIPGRPNFPDFKKALFDSLVLFSNKEEFKPLDFRVNEKTGVVTVDFLVLSNDRGVNSVFKINDNDIFTRVISFEYQTNNLISGSLVENALRMFCSNLTYQTDRTVRYPIKFMSSEPMLESGEILERVIKNNLPSELLKARLERISSPKACFSLAELEFVYSTLNRYTKSLDGNPDVRITLLKSDKETSPIVSVDEVIPLKDEIIAQGFNLEEYFSRGSSITQLSKSVAKTNVKIYDVLNFVTWNASHNDDLSEEQKDDLLLYSSEFLSQSRIFDFESNRVKMPTVFFN